MTIIIFEDDYIFARVLFLNHFVLRFSKDSPLDSIIRVIGIIALRGDRIGFRTPKSSTIPNISTYPNRNAGQSVEQIFQLHHG